MTHHVSVNIHLSSSADVRVSGPLAAHPHLILGDGATIFFGFNNDEVVRNLHELRDAVQALIHQVRAERARREELAAAVDQVAGVRYGEGFEPHGG